MKNRVSQLAGDPNFDATTEASKREVDFLQLALRYKWWLLASLVAGALLGEGLYRKMGPEYEAKSRILVSQKASVPIADAAGNTFGERGQHIAIIMSPMIVGKALDTHHLRKLPSLAREGDPVQEVIDGLKVLRTAGDERSFLNVLDLSYRNRYRDDAQRVLEAIIDEYQAYLLDTKKEHTGEISTLINEANESVLAQLHQQEQEYLDFRQQAPLHWRAPSGTGAGTTAATNVHAERMLVVEAQMRDNLLKRAETQSRIDTLKSAMAKGEPQSTLEEIVRLYLSLEKGTAGASGLGSPPEQMALDSQMIPLLLEEKKLTNDFAQDHPDVIAVRRGIQTLLEFYRTKGIRLPEEVLASGVAKIDFVALYLRSLEQTLAELEHRDVMLNKLFEEEATQAKQFTKYQLQDQALVDNMQRTKQLFQTIVDRIGKQQLSTEASGYDLRKISPIQAELVFKRHLKFLAAGVFLCLMTTLGVAYLITLQDTRLRTLDDVRNHLMLPVLGAVPSFNPASQREVETSAAPQLAGSLCYFHKPGSPEAEAFRSVRTALYVCAQARGAKVIQVTSPMPGDGKSTFTANLALAMGQSGKKVLLIDGDMRRPTTHGLLGLRAEVGMADVLAGDVELMNAVQPTRFGNLSVLTAGSLPLDPAERLSSEALNRLISDARREYDFVLVDTPPLLAVSDPCVVAPAVDGLLMLVRLEKTKRASAQRAAELLDTHGVKVLGVVANGLDLEGDTYGDGSKEAYYTYLNRPGTETAPTTPPATTLPV